MNEKRTGGILINVVDGTRKPLPDAVRWSARIHDARTPNAWQMVNVSGAGSAELVKGLRWSNNLFDNYTAIVNAEPCSVT